MRSNDKKHVMSELRKIAADGLYRKANRFRNPLLIGRKWFSYIIRTSNGRNIFIAVDINLEMEKAGICEKLVHLDHGNTLFL